MIRLSFCAACGDDNPDHLHQHHLIPKALGGTDDEPNLITLCAICHGKIHDIEGDLNHKSLVKAGQARAIARGVKLGHKKQIILGCKKSISEWADEVEIPYSTLQKRFARGWLVERILTEPGRCYQYCQNR
jgi:hypothetical protein